MMRVRQGGACSGVVFAYRAIQARHEKRSLPDKTSPLTGLPFGNVNKSASFPALFDPALSAVLFLANQGELSQTVFAATYSDEHQLNKNAFFCEAQISEGVVGLPDPMAC